MKFSLRQIFAFTFVIAVCLIGFVRWYYVKPLPWNEYDMANIEACMEDGRIAVVVFYVGLSTRRNQLTFDNFSVPSVSRQLRGKGVVLFARKFPYPKDVRQALTAVGLTFDDLPAVVAYGRGAPNGVVVLSQLRDNDSRLPRRLHETIQIIRLRATD